MVPILGTRKLTRLEENIGAADIKLTEEELSAINKTLARIKVAGSSFKRIKKDY